MSTFKLITAAIIAVVVLPACAKQHAHNCGEAVEQAFTRIETALKKAPKLAYTPVRTGETSGMLLESCKNGMKHGHIHDTAKLNSLFDDIEARSHKPKISTEEARYLLADTAMAHTFLAGYEIGAGETEF